MKKEIHISMEILISIRESNLIAEIFKVLIVLML